MLVPAGAPAARRIEHRVAGGDINPYTFIAAVLGAALIGMEDGMSPPDPITGNAYERDLPQIPSTWEAAIEAFEKSEILPRIFHPELLRNYAMTKRQEKQYYDELTEAERIDLYLDTV